MEQRLEQPGPAVADPQDQIAVAKGQVLDCWSEHDWRDAVSLDELSPFDRITITTLNHTYEIVVASPDDRTVLLRGGAFPDFVAARLIGSSLGGSTIKLRTVAVGFRVELMLSRDRCLITTPVNSLAVAEAGCVRRRA